MTSPTAAFFSAFLTSTKGCVNSEVTGVASRAVAMAGIVAVLFTVAGPPLLAALSITLSDFKVAGGIVLVLLGLENTLNFSLSPPGKKKASAWPPSGVWPFSRGWPTACW